MIHDIAGRQFFWTKTWGRPGGPSGEALVFNSKNVRDSALRRVNPGDIVVYLTADGTNADPMVRGRVSGAVEIEGNPVTAEEMGIIERARDVDFRQDGRFRWPYGISVKRTWRVLDQESNDALIPDHREFRMQGAATIHEMSNEEAIRFLGLRVQEQLDDDVASEEIFSVSLQRPWRQKAGERGPSIVRPGADLYVACIYDSNGMTFKVGSGKHKDRIKALNEYRRPSQGETTWSLVKGLCYDFEDFEAARDAEDFLLEKAKAQGFGSQDHSEFLVKITMTQIRELFTAAVQHGNQRDVDLKVSVSGVLAEAG